MNKRERDIVIRTIIGEAAQEPEEGQAAVAHIILNRVNSGKFGKDPISVVLAPNQFEPWSTRAGELARISPKSPIYNKVGQIVDRVVSGDIPDPTNGATHFLQEEIVRQRRGGSLPNWASGAGQRIGQHTFFNPSAPKDALSAINAAIGARPATTAAMQYAPTDVPASSFINPRLMNSAPQLASADADSIINSFRRAPEEPAAAAGGGDVDGIINSFRKPPAAAITVQPTIGDRPAEDIWKNRENPPEVPLVERAEKAVGGLSSNIGSAINKYTAQGQGLMKQGWEEGGLPGMGKAALGLGAWTLAPVSGLVEGIFTDPLAKLTGNRDFAEKASLIVPFGGAKRAAAAANPSNRALNEIIKDVSSEQMATAIPRMERNQRITLMDVADAVRGNTAGLANDPRNVAAMSHLSDFQRSRMGERAGDTRGAFEEALGPLPNVKQTVDDLEARAVKTGKEVIEPVVARAGTVEITPVVKWIDSQMPAAVLNRLKKGDTAALLNSSEKIKRLWELRQRIRGDFEDRPRMFMDPKDAHALEIELRTQWGKDPATGFEAREIRRSLIDAIDEAVPLPKVPDDHTRLYVGENNLGRFYADDLEKARAQGGTVGYVDVPTADLALFPNPAGTKNSVSAFGGNGGNGSAVQQKYFNEAQPLGGQYKRALKQYAGDKKAEEAFTKGFDVFSNPHWGTNKAIENHPDYWKDWAKNASDIEKEAVKKGILIGADSRISNMRRGLDIPEGGFTQERIAAIIGDKEAKKLVDTLNDWRDIARTNKELMEGSDTARRLAGQERRKVPETGPVNPMNYALPTMVGMASNYGGAHPMLSVGGGLAALLAQKGGKKLMQGDALSKNRAYAEWASATGAKKEDLIAALKRELSRREPVTKGEKLLNLIPPSLLRIAPP